MKKKSVKTKEKKHQCNLDKDTILFQNELMAFLEHLKTLFPKQPEDDIARATLFMLAHREAVENTLGVALWHLNNISNELISRYDFGDNS